MSTWERVLGTLVFAILPMLVLTILSVLAEVWPHHGNTFEVSGRAMLGFYLVGLVLIWKVTGSWKDER